MASKSSSADMPPRSTVLVFSAALSSLSDTDPASSGVCVRVCVCVCVCVCVIIVIIITHTHTHTCEHRTYV